MKEIFFSIISLLVLCVVAECWEVPPGNEVVEIQYEQEQPESAEVPEFPAFPNAGPYAKFSQSEAVDEETINKAEKIADEDLLSGLNEILKNNETLEDVLRAENIRDLL